MLTEINRQLDQTPLSLQIGEIKMGQKVEGPAGYILRLPLYYIEDENRAILLMTQTFALSEKANNIRVLSHILKLYRRPLNKSLYKEIKEILSLEGIEFPWIEGMKISDLMPEAIIVSLTQGNDGSFFINLKL